MTTKTKFKIGLVLAVIAVLIYFVAPFFFPESAKRGMKNFQSNWLGGLNRTCTIYALSGQKIKEYKGSFDLKPSERQVAFDIKGKRVIIRNATVICEEN